MVALTPTRCPPTFEPTADACGELVPIAVDEVLTILI